MTIGKIEPQRQARVWLEFEAEDVSRILAALDELIAYLSAGIEASRENGAEVAALQRRLDLVAKDRLKWRDLQREMTSAITVDERTGWPPPPRPWPHAPPREKPLPTPTAEPVRP